MTDPFVSPFSEAQLAQLQGELGSNLDEPDLAERYERLGGDVDAVIVEVLRIRLADATQRPTSFTIPGEYSEDRSASVKLLAERLGALDSEVGGGLARIVAGPFSGIDRAGVAYDSEESLLRGRRCLGGR